MLSKDICHKLVSFCIKALELGLKPIVVINKVDKENCRPDEVHDKVFDLFFNLDATEEQLDFPTFYGSSKQGWFNTSLEPTDKYFTNFRWDFYNMFLLQK